MAITFSNIASTHVIDPLTDILSAEFRGHTTLRLFDADPPKGSSWLQLSGFREELVEEAAGATTRRYTIDFAYVVKVGAASGKKALTERANFMGRLFELLRQNKDYTPAKGYCWHDGQIGATDYSAETDEDNENGLARVAFEWSCAVTHIIE